jgi:hypothetical protein
VSEDGFISVTNKRKRRNPLAIGTSNKKCALTGVPRRSHLHVWNFNPDTSVESIMDYVKSEVSDDSASLDLEIEKLKVTRGNYASFRISVNSDSREILIEPSFWPKNVRIDNYSFRKPRLATTEG